VLTAFEAIGAAALAPVFRHQPRLRDPFGGRHPAYTVLVELSSTLDTSRLALDDLLESALAEQLEAADGGEMTDVFPGKPSELWEIRHHVSESLRQEGETLAFDVSVPRSSLAAFVDAARATVAAGWPFVRFCDYGTGGRRRPREPDLDPAEAPRPAAELRRSCSRGSTTSPSSVRRQLQRRARRRPAQPGLLRPLHADLVKEVCRLLKMRLDPAGLLGTVRLG
jgi:FAD linked oxidases, C-terminal domain.